MSKQNRHLEFRHVTIWCRYHWQNLMHWGKSSVDSSCTSWNMNRYMFIQCIMSHTLALEVFSSLDMVPVLALGLSSVLNNTASSHYIVCTLWGQFISLTMALVLVLGLSSVYNNTAFSNCTVRTLQGLFISLAMALVLVLGLSSVCNNMASSKCTAAHCEVCLFP